MKRHLRDNKTCLNCGASVEERYCSSCGQENTEPKESFSHLLRHFFEDVTHYDSKFFITIKDLLFKPGFLTKEYLAGKRANYLHPIRLYVFISFLYFLLAFSFSSTSHRAEEGLVEKTSYETRKHISDNVHAMILVARRDTVNGTIKEALLNRVLEKMQDKNDADQEHFNFIIVGGLDYKMLRTYDSLQKSLPPAARDHNIKSWLYSRWFSTLSKYGKGSLSLLKEKTNHAIPKIMFILLPIFALFLTVFYSRRAYFYTDHAIFSLHFHAAVFLLFLFFTIVGLIFPILSRYLDNIQLILPCIYLYVWLRRVYQQSVILSILKTIGLVFIYSVFIVVGYAVTGLGTLL
jgi:hypothetical protein